MAVIYRAAVQRLSLKSRRGRLVAVWLSQLARTEATLHIRARALLYEQARKLEAEFASGRASAVEREIRRDLAAWERLLRAHYRGTAQTFSRPVLDRFTPTKASFIDLVRGWIESQAARKARLITEATIEIVRSFLSDAEADGAGVEEIGRGLRRHVLDLSRSRAVTIARTETHSAATYAQDAAAESTGLELEREWISVEDERTRESHAAADGQTRRMNEPFVVGDAALMRPGDPDGPAEEVINCFLPGTLVEGAFVAGSKARYTGPAWEIETARGHRLRVTPNHPVLAAHGWVPASEIREGHYLLSRTLDFEPRVKRNVDDQNRPARIEQVFDSLASNGAVCLAVVGALDFHGDAIGFDGDVEIVRAGGKLRDRIEPGSVKAGHDLALVATDASHPSVLSGSSLDLDLDRVALSSTSRPGGRHLTFDSYPIESERRPLQALRIGLAADWNVPIAKDPQQRRSTHVEFACELLKAGAGEIAEDRVVRVERFAFDSHVYDLQSATGWIVSDGIISSNCRCVLDYDTPR